MREDLPQEVPLQGYGESFARVYNLRWGGFSSALAPLIHAFYEGLPIAAANKRLLDVACGTGQLLTWFLRQGYACTGLDSSLHMLELARRNAGHYAREGKADFIRADASDFRLDRGYGLVVSTFDALNHLPDRRSLASCFRCVFGALSRGGRFIFDLNTEKGLRMWNSISVEETEELLILNRGIFGEGMRRAYNHITGFLKVGSNRYERFQQTAYNTAFVMAEVERDLGGAGFEGVYFTTMKDFSARVSDPEELTRVFFVAKKPD
jgi:SAM-dependent methyltransferase